MKTLIIHALFLLNLAQAEDKIKLTQKDVTFYGTGKVSRYQQKSNDELVMMRPLFFAEIFIKEGGLVKNASITSPGKNGKKTRLSYRYSESNEIGDVMYLSSIFESFESLEDEFPMGEYKFSFETSEGIVNNSIVSYQDNAFPPHPIIILIQDDTEIETHEVDTSKDLLITWPDFSAGRSDKNNILDDPIFVAIDSCNIEDIFHSGRPFEKNGYLSFEASSYLIPANGLEPGQKYEMYVEHAIFTDTQIDHGIPGFATLASSTYMSFNTLGDNDPSYCLEK